MLLSNVGVTCTPPNEVGISFFVYMSGRTLLVEISTFRIGLLLRLARFRLIRGSVFASSSTGGGVLDFDVFSSIFILMASVIAALV